MKKIRGTKPVRLAAVLMTLVLLVTLALPYAAAMYAERIAHIAGNLTGQAHTDLDNLFIHMMNESLPVGSIYMTTKITTAKDMMDRYGGKWVAWGQGRVPLGVDEDDPDFATPEKTGGNLFHSRSATIPLGGLTVNGSIGLTADGDIAIKGGGIGLTAGSASVEGSQQYSGSTSLDMTMMPSHTHGHTMWHTTNTHYAGNGATNTSKGFSHGNDTGSQTAWYSDPAQTGYRTNWWVQINSRANQTGSAFSVYYQVDITDITKFTFSYPTPTAKYNLPTYTHNRQTVNNIDLKTVSTGSASADYTDKTIQPYITCYMYKRLELAKLTP